MAMISCGKTKPKNASSDGPDYFEREKKKKLDYFQTILNNPTRGLFEDFDIWEMKPLDKINKVDSTLILPVLEVVQDRSGNIKELIVHQKKGFSDTLFVKRNSKNSYLLNRVVQCPIYYFNLDIYLYNDSIITIQSMQNSDTLNSLDIYSVSKRNESKIFVYNILRGYEDSDIDTVFYVNPSEKTPSTYKPFYKSRIVEKITMDDSLKINLFFDEFRYATNIKEFSSGYINTNVSSNSPEKYLWSELPSFNYCMADESSNNTFVKYRSYFWFLWNTKWNNNGFAANPESGP